MYCQHKHRTAHFIELIIKQPGEKLVFIGEASENKM